MCLNYLIIHSTNTKKNKCISNNLDKNSLYSDVINVDGNIISLLCNNKSNRTNNWNLIYNDKNIDKETRHIAYVGGINKENTHAKDTRTDEQKETLELYVKYMIKRHPDLIVAGYNQLKEKSSPAFEVGKWLQEIGVKKKNIFK